MKFVEYDSTHEAAYLKFAHKVGEFSLGTSFSYYGASDAIVVRRHLLIDDGADPSVVIGAVTTKEQGYMLAGQIIRVAVATYPISLGSVEARYAMAGILIFRRLLERYPLNFLLGVPPKLSLMLGWRLNPVPYLFMPRRFAALASKQLSNRPALASAIRKAGSLGLFSPAEALLHTRARRPTRKVDIVRVAAFDTEFNEWWLTYSKTIKFGLVRDSRQMNAMFPYTIDAFERLVFRRNGRIVGFAVLLIPRSEDSQRAMGANVVTLVEFCADAADLSDVAAALTQQLWCRRLDAVIVNHSHGPTIDALKAAGFWPRTTNMYLAISPTLQARLDDAGVQLAQMVISRADGDGPIGLGVNL